jgi:heat shock protein HslJ
MPTLHRGPRRALVASAVLAAAVVAACSTPSASPTAAPASAGSPAALELDGTKWLLTDYLSPDGALLTVPAAVTPLAQFQDGTMTGNAGCNTFSGPYSVSGESLTLGPMVSTKMACEEPMASVEAAYLAALEVVDKAALLDNGKLQLWDSEGKTTLAFLKGD